MEKLEDLQVGGLKIYQRTDLYRFTSDAVLLSDFAVVKKNDYVLDLGTGSGIIPLLIYGKNPVKKITGIEIQRELVDLARKSVEYNDLTDKIEIIPGRIQNAHRILDKHPDVIVCNPPYRKMTDGVLSKNKSNLIAKFEAKMTLRDVLECVRRNLKFGGKFFMIHSAERFADIVSECKRNDISLRRVRFVQAKKNSLAHLVMIEGRNNANSQLKILPPLILKEDDSTDSEEVLRIYSRGQNVDV